MFSVIALIYAVLNMQFIYNIPDNRAIEYWYLSITDSSISWFFAISTLYASYYAKGQLKWLAKITIIWAITVTIVTLPVWEWEVIGFLAQHYITFVLYMALLISLVYTTIKEKNSSLGLVTACIFIYMLGGFYDLTHVCQSACKIFQIRGGNNVQKFPPQYVTIRCFSRRTLECFTWTSFTKSAGGIGFNNRAFLPSPATWAFLGQRCASI